ncbi:MAG: GNAT family N-acetyltransferase [Negativicutes bacterium]|nr:GNAT family N-acetyltransferase [Negativicutes bacterium]
MLQLVTDRLILKDIDLPDIEDYVRWYTTETEWMAWDAPWELDEPLDTKALTELYQKRLRLPLTARRTRFELYLPDNRHIGWVSSYLMENGKPAIGIDIPLPEDRKQGLGTLAYLMLIHYFLSNGIKEIYSQTWSGNLAMIALAEKIGFYECERLVGRRKVGGSSYDALTFRLDASAFLQKYSQYPILLYQTDLNGITAEQLNGFCVGWQQPLSGEELMKILQNSYRFVLALEFHTKKPVGLVNALSDGVRFAFLPLLEVLPEMQHHGIGSRLMQSMLDQLRQMSSIDLICDEALQSYYERFSMHRGHAMLIRKQ